MGLSPPTLDPGHASATSFGLSAEIDLAPRRGERPSGDWRSYERLRGRRGEAEVCIALCRAKAPHLDDVYLTAGNHHVQVDHVAIAGSVFVVVESKNYSGTLARGPGRAAPVQVLAGGRVSPLGRDPRRQLAAHVAALESFLAHGTLVRGFVAMAGAATTGELLPDGIVRASALPGLLSGLAAAHPATEGAYADWWALHRHANDRSAQAEAARLHRLRWRDGPT